MMPTEKGLITITQRGQDKEPAKQDSVGQSVVTNVSIVSDQLVIAGENLGGVTKVRITGPSGFDQTFAIESQSGSSLVANGLSNIAFAVGSVFDLILTDAQGAATHQVTFTLQDGAVTASKLDDMGAGVGQVLKYDGSSWAPGDLGALSYAGNWDASSLAAPNVSPAAGEFYIVSVAGSTDLSGGTGTNSWVVGDWAVWNNVASQWEKVANGSSVTSFNGRSGPVIPATNDYTWAQIDKTTSPIGDLSNVNTTGAGVGSVLKFDGTNWIVGTDNTAAAGSVDSTAITDGSIVDADVNAAANIAQSKINNLTTDLASKLNLSGGTMTGDLTVPNLITSGNVDGVDVSTLATSVATNTTNIGNNTSAIAGKQNTITTGTTAQYLRGDLSLATLNTTAVVEGTNLYFTDTRARTAAVLNSTAGSETGQAASVAAMKAYVTANAGVGDFLADGSVAMTGDLTLNAQQELRLADSDSSNYVALRSPDPLAANYTLTFPADDGTPGQVLSTDGSGALSWISTGAGSVTSVTASAPLASSGGATPNLTITQANGSTNGYLSSTDWATFNSKQAAITTGATTQYLRGDLTLATLQDDVRATLLTGFSSGAGTVAATDTILQAVQKLDGNIGLKENAITAAAATTYFRGDKTFVTLDTAVVPENTNLYHTTARARTAAVVNSTAGSETNQAASVAAMKSYVSTNAGTVTNVATGAGLTGGPITNTGTIAIATGGVTASHLAAGAVETSEIADGTVLLADLNTSSVDGRYVVNSGDTLTGNYTTTGRIQAGTGSGGVAMTVNDGYGNANLTFNHVSGIPEQDGNAGRIEVNTDSTSNASMYFEVGQNVTSGAAVGLTTVMTLRSTGDVGIGTSTPTSTFEVNGAARNTAAESNSTSTINFSTSNIQFTTSNCGTFNLHNLKDGGAYTFIVKGTTSATCSFNAYSDAGTTSLTVHLPSGHGATSAGEHTFYSLLVAGTDVYLSWIKEFD